MNLGVLHASGVRIATPGGAAALERRQRIAAGAREPRDKVPRNAFYASNTP